MQRVYINYTLAGNSTTIQDPEIVHRLFSVLRMKPGDQYYVFDENGTEYLVEITAIDKKMVSVGFVKKIERNTKPTVWVNLYPALFKKQRFEWMLEKCTELGVMSICPITTEHTIIKASDQDSESARKRYEKIVVSASEQSELTYIPAVHYALPLTEILKTISGKILVAAERSDSTGDWPILNAGDEVSLFIGPEGGWSPQELELFKAAGATFLSFGKRILRAETACIAGASLLLTNK